MNAVKRIPGSAAPSSAGISPGATISIPPGSPGTRKIRFRPTRCGGVVTALSVDPPCRPFSPPATSTAVQRAPIARECRPGGSLPREEAAALASTPNERGRQSTIVGDARNRLRNRGGIVGIEKQSCVPDELGQDGEVRARHRQATCHSLEHWEPESLLECRQHET